MVARMTIAAAAVVAIALLQCTITTITMVTALPPTIVQRMSHTAATEKAHALYKQYLMDHNLAPPPPMDAATHPCANITAPPNWILPQDLSVHDHLHEWWFYLGLLTDSKTNTTYGMDFTLWRFATACGDPTAAMYFIYIGIADEKANVYYSGVTPVWDPFVTKNKGNTSMSLVAPDQVFSVIQDPKQPSLFSLSGWVHQWPSTTQSMNISIKLNSVYGDLPMAIDGFCPCASPGRLGLAQLEATRMDVLGGSFTVNDVAHSFDRGDVYLQHMWQSATDWMPPDENVGWDWAWGILDNGWSYSLTHLRTSLNVYTNYSYCNVIRPGADGKLENIYLRYNEFTRIGIDPIWTSPHTNVTYTLGHRLTIPSLGLVLDSVPLIHDNEVNWHDLGFRYYEGVGRVSGTVNGAPVRGSGGTELVGIKGLS